MGFRRLKREEPRVDLTPMVDVVFLLLIFFMISTTFVETPGLSINLPESGARSINKEPKEFKVYVTKAGKIFFAKEELSLEQFRSRIAAQKVQDAKETTFLLLADADARHGIVVQLMDLARDAGFMKLAIATDKKDGR